MDKRDFKDWGPYISYGKNAGTEIRIAWKSRKFSHHRWIKYGKTENCELLIEEKWIEPTKSHMMVLTDLEYDTDYYYRISRDIDKDMIYHFRTGKRSGDKFEFTVVGDIHANPNENISTVFTAMQKYRPDHDFSVTVGDSINDGNDPTHWNSYFYDLREYLPKKPQLNSTGNHDTGKNEDKYCRFLRAFNHHPYENPKSGGYYLVNYSNAVLFFIDSCNAGGWEPTPSDEQYDWLEENLEKYANKDKWIFFFLHHQIFSTGDFSCAHIMETLFRPLCQEYHVDAVFYGHDHHYECFWVDRDMDYGGTLYFVAGTGGTQNRIDHSIMGDRDGRTKYIWPGRILNVRKDGVPPITDNITERAEGFRNDKIVQESQLFGILEPSFISVTIEGNLMNLKSIGWHGELYHEIEVKRAGTGRKYTDESEIFIK